MNHPFALPIRHNFNIPPPPPPAAAELNPGAHAHRRTLFMHMSFYWGKNAEVLFSGWPGNDTGMYALAIIFVFFLAVIVEFLSNLNLVKPGSNRVASGFFQAGIHAIRAGFAYMVMLAVMSYNGGIFIAAIVGHAVGYVIFGSPIFKKDSEK